MTRLRIFYWIPTILLCALMLFSAGMYLSKTEMVTGMYETLGYPSYLIIPLAIAKIAGVIAILTKWSKMLKEWAYAGFFFDMVLAAMAHVAVDESPALALIGVLLLALSYGFDARLYGNASTKA